MAAHLDAGAAIRFAVLSSSSYLACLAAFERWLDPLFRRGLGLLVGRRIAWLPALGAFSIWGVEETERTELEAAVALAGIAFVASGALVPIVVPVLLGSPLARDAAIGATHSLLSLAMVGHFLCRVLRRGRNGF